MERKIGEIFEYNGEWYQCVVAIQGCRECSFRTQDYCTRHSECFSAVRSDGISVIFKKLEKVGEPYGHYCPSGRIIYFQRYKIFNKLYSHNTEYIMCDFNEDSIVSIELKQNKENMEDNKKQTSLNSTKGIYEKFKGKTVQCLVNNKDGDLVNGYGIVCGYTDKYLIIGFTNGYEGCIKSFTDNVFLENRDFLSYRFWNISHVDDKPFIKPFNLEAARSGKPVCTRDGRKARIICFDYNGETGDYPIVALVHHNKGNKCYETVLKYTSDGLFNKYGDCQHNDDLMMLPEKKEGWVNVMEGTAGKVYVGNDIYRTEDEAKEGAPRFTSRLIASIPIEWEE